jgi:hypothetical protein
MDHLIKHFTRDEAPVESYGPFAFLNPTTKRYKLRFQPKLREPSKEESDSKDSRENETLQATQDSNTNGDEVRAEDVHRLFRTRDNRKGSYSP